MVVAPAAVIGKKIRCKKCESVIAVPKMLKDVFRLIHGRAEEGQVRLLVSTAHKLPMLRAERRPT